MVLQQDKPIQINQWVFIGAQSKVIKVSIDDDIDSTLEVVELNELNRQILWHMIESFPETVTANELLALFDDGTVTRNKLYQAIAKLRRIFDDSTHNATYIETVPRKGYRWLVQPVNREEVSKVDEVVAAIESVANDDLNLENTNAHDNNDENGVSVSEITEQPDIKSSVLDKNIFDDLGFIEKTEAEPKSSVNDDEESKVVVPANNETSKKYRWFFGGVIVFIAFILAYMFYQPKPPTLFVASDKLYIKPITIHEKSGDISPQTLSKIQWWVEQKLQHIPAMSVLPTTDENRVPRIHGVVERTDEQLEITLTFVSKQTNSLPQKISLIINDISDADDDIKNGFNNSLNQLVTGSDNSSIANDICALNSFITSKYAEDICLVDVYQQYKLLLEDLSNENKVEGDELVTLKLLENLAIKTLTTYKKHSLGYEMLASFYHATYQFDKAHEQLLLAMERNQNEPTILKSLSESYRRLGEFNHSLSLVEALLNRDIEKQYALYWKAYDLVALGYLYKGQKVIGENDIQLTTLEQKVYFFGINYNQLNNILNEVENHDVDTLNFINDIISDHVDCGGLKAVSQCIEKVTANIDSSLPITHWQAAMAHLMAESIEDGYGLIKNDPLLVTQDMNFVGSGDKIFFIPSLANMLFKMDKASEAKQLLNSLITFIQSSNSNQMYTLTLAEAYALLGQHSDALEQMEKLLAQGWLPNAKYQIWSLTNNPNFSAIKQQWQFINLVELIENRRKLIGFRILDLKNST